MVSPELVEKLELKVEQIPPLKLSLSGTERTHDTATISVTEDHRSVNLRALIAPEGSHMHPQLLLHNGYLNYFNAAVNCTRSGVSYQLHRDIEPESKSVLHSEKALDIPDNIPIDTVTEVYIASAAPTEPTNVEPVP
jgi:hypothetical protein